VAAFQLILLSEREKPIRTAPPDGFSLIQFCSRAEIEMAAERAAHSVISAEELTTWWTPKEAARYAATCVGDISAAQGGLWQRLVGGLIETAATASSLTPKGRAPIPTKTPEIIPRRFWKDFSEHGSDFWNGDARFFLPGSSTSSVFQAFGIKLCPDDVRDCFPEPTYRFVDKPAKQSAEPSQDTASPKQNQGGRPRKDWWDDFWIDICGQIYEGEMKPKRQADLEKVMLDWATKHGHEMSEATARKVAKKLFVAWRLGG